MAATETAPSPGGAPEFPLSGIEPIDRAILLERAQEAVAFERGRAEAAEAARDAAVTELDVLADRLNTVIRAAVTAELAEARAQIGHLSSALAGDNEGVRLWMSDCARFVDKHLQHAAEVSLKLGKVRELAESWTEADGRGEPTREMKTEAECGRQVLAVIAAGTQADADEVNDGKPVRWITDPAPGGMVCAVSDPSRPDGICGIPVESEPCGKHGEAGPS